MRCAYLMDQGITYYRRVLKGIAQFARHRGDWELRIEPVTFPDLFPVLDRAGYDGLILGTFADKSEAAGQLRMPAVSVANANPGLPFPQVISDDCEVGRMVARHLLAKGYRHFAFLGHQVVYSEQRWNGFASTILDAQGEDAMPARSAVLGPAAIGRWPRVPRANPSPPPTRVLGPAAIGRWLRRLPRPLGLMAATDYLGSEVIAACHNLGLRVPEDVAVVGVDDDDLYSEMTRPPLTSVAQQPERIGYLAAEYLMLLLRGQKIPQVTLVPPGPLMARQSSQAIATADDLVVQAVGFLQQNLARDTVLAEMAGALSVSRRSLELRFKATLSQTPGQELLRLKIERAQNLLATTSLPLKQIALLSGFGTPVRLSHVFRNSNSQTPLEYRRGFSPHGR